MTERKRRGGGKGEKKGEKKGKGEDGFHTFSISAAAALASSTDPESIFTTCTLGSFLNSVALFRSLTLAKMMVSGLAESCCTMPNPIPLFAPVTNQLFLLLISSLALVVVLLR
jgi:hypothetical protein